MTSVKHIASDRIVRKNRDIYQKCFLPFTAHQLKLFNLFLATVDINQIHERSIYISYADYRDVLNIGYQHKSDINKTLSSFTEVPITYIGKTGLLIREPLFLRCELIKDENVCGSFFLFEYNPIFKFLFYGYDKKVGYSKYPLSTILKLKSKYSIILYSIFSDCSKQGYKKHISVSNLLSFFGIDENSSTNTFSYFEARILKPAIIEINESTDLSITYDKFKMGRRVVEIMFDIKRDAE